MNEYTYAYCWMDGVIKFGRYMPQRAFMLAMDIKGSHLLREAVISQAKLDYDGKTLLVPGVPDANSVGDAARVISRFAVQSMYYLSILEVTRHS